MPNGAEFEKVIPVSVAPSRLKNLQTADTAKEKVVITVPDDINLLAKVCPNYLVLLDGRCI